MESTGGVPDVVDYDELADEITIDRLLLRKFKGL